MRSLLRLGLFGLFLPVLLTGCRAPDKYSEPIRSPEIRWEPGISKVPDMPTNWKWDPFLDTLEDRTLRFFLDVTPRSTGLTPDRWPSQAPSSVASVGFGLTTYPIAAERHLISRAEAADRVLTALRFIAKLPQGSEAQGVGGYKGFYYHFVDPKTGLRAWNCELSTIDTGLLLAGVLFCEGYFDRHSGVEDSIRTIADALYRRVDWKWFTGGTNGIPTGWYPDRGFNAHTWQGYTEAMILWVLALGSPTSPVPEWFVFDWYRGYQWSTFAGIEHVGFGPLFGHQYSHCWIDFRGVRDRYMWGRGLDYFENSRRATYAHRAYAMMNPQGYRDYSSLIWGMTACDGPKDTLMAVDGRLRKFWTYRAREVSDRWVEDDGTLAPTAAAGSIPFAPEICVPALKAMRDTYGARLWREYGFADAVNPSFRTPETGGEPWVAKDYIGIDQGPIAIMIENMRTGLVWNTMKKSPYVIDGLRKMGFSGGWLDEVK
jgi:hypothetical protein